MKPTIRLDGRHHSIPRCMYDFFGNLESLAGVEEARGGKFLCRRRHSKYFETKIQYYDEQSRILRIRAQHKQFIAYFDLRINPDLRQKIEDYIVNYKPN